MLKDKIIIVTGGSGLLGREIIRHLADNGAYPLNLDINVEDAPELGTFRCDITLDESVECCLGKIDSYFGRIDGLVNNAYPRTSDWGLPFEELPTDSWRKNVDWQLNSYFVMSRAVLKRMKKQKSGSIVNMASIYGVVGNDFTIYEGASVGTAAPYSAIKGGLISFTRYLASLYGAHDIRVNCVSPGGIFDNQDPAFVAAYERKVPMKRMGTPSDVSPSVGFLLSEGARYITGHNLIVDGGWTAI